MRLHQFYHAKLHFISGLILLFFTSTASSQKNQKIESKVKAFIDARSPDRQYEALASLMEFNANVSVDEASYYFELFNEEGMRKVDERYALLSHFLLADVLYYHDQADSALHHYLYLSSSARLVEENMLAASGLGNAAYVLSDLGDKMGAINLLKQNINISNSTGDIRDLSDHTFSIARYYADLEIRDSAIHYFEKTIDIDRRANNINGMLYNMQTLLDQYLRAGQITKADILCKECIESAKKANERRALAACHYYSGLSYLRQNDFAKSEEEFKMAIKIDRDRSDSTRMSRYYRGLGDVLLRQGFFDLANKNFELAISFSKKNKKQEEIIESYLSYSRALRNQGSYERAIEFNGLASEIIEESKLATFLLPLYQNYIKIYSKQGEIQEAFHFSEKQSELLSRKLNTRNAFVTDQSTNAYDLFKMENINKSLQAEKSAADEKVKRRNTQIISGGVISVLAIILIYLFSQIQKQRSQQMAQALQYQVLEKEMTALRSQMNPHFLFNSLSSINDYIMHKDARHASKYLTKFSHLMRIILNNSREKLITLEEELNAAKLYVEMENLRFKEQFEFVLNIDSRINIDNTLIPSMLIQPYLENAIKHGLRNSNNAGALLLDLQRKADQLEIKIEDNGIGREEARKLKGNKKGKHKSHGMSITKDRIDLLNKIHNIDAGAEIIDKHDPSGTIVLLRIKLLTKDMHEKVSNPEETEYRM